MKKILKASLHIFVVCFFILSLFLILIYSGEAMPEVLTIWIIMLVSSFVSWDKNRNSNDGVLRKPLQSLLGFLKNLYKKINKKYLLLYVISPLILFGIFYSINDHKNFETWCYKNIGGGQNSYYVTKPVKKFFKQYDDALSYCKNVMKESYKESK